MNCSKLLLRTGSLVKNSNFTLGGRRFLNIHEYASMELMRKYEIETPKTASATTPQEARAVYTKIIGDENDCVIKAMVLAGGRGLGHFNSGLKGGVHVLSEPEEIETYAAKMLGNNLITKQTGSEGLPCNRIMLAERMYMRREMYISIMLDRSSGGVLFVASPAGGTSIEDVAHHTPNLIFRQPVDIMEGVTDKQARYLSECLGFHHGRKSHNECAELIKKLYRMFTECDCLLLEVNPLAETPDGRVVVCDAKINFDDNAEFKQQALFSLRDKSQEDPREVEAAKYNLNYVGLDGNIGCMVNGAGLAMATMDIIKLNGGEPANFLDVGGGATEQQVQQAFQLLNSNPHCKVILVNIFGGIMRCDIIAAGIINACKAIHIEKPIVVRLQGTNVIPAKKLLQESGIRMIVTDDLDDAARKAVSIAQIVDHSTKANLKVQFIM